MRSQKSYTIVELKQIQAFKEGLKAAKSKSIGKPEKAAPVRPNPRAKSKTVKLVAAKNPSPLFKVQMFRTRTKDWKTLAHFVEKKFAVDYAKSLADKNPNVSFKVVDISK